MRYPYPPGVGFSFRLLFKPDPGPCLKPRYQSCRCGGRWATVPGTSVIVGYWKEHPHGKSPRAEYEVIGESLTIEGSATNCEDAKRSLYSLSEAIIERKAPVYLVVSRGAENGYTVVLRTRLTERTPTFSGGTLHSALKAGLQALQSPSRVFVVTRDRAHDSQVRDLIFGGARSDDRENLEGLAEQHAIRVVCDG